MSPKPRPFNLLAMLLAGALVLSLALNGFLLYSRPTLATDYDDWQEAEADLRLTQRLLARCQADHQEQDSLVALGSSRPATRPTSAVAAQ